MSNTSILYKQLNWLTDQLSNIDYSKDKQTAILYELGLLRALLAQLAHNDSANALAIRTSIQSNPYYKRNTAK